MNRISDSIRQALADADGASDIHDIVECARAALVDAEAVSLFSLETPHPDFGSVHWIVGRAETPGGDPDGDYLVLAIPEHAPERGQDADGNWPLFSAGAEDLGEAFRQIPAGFVESAASISQSAQAH